MTPSFLSDEQAIRKFITSKLAQHSANWQRLVGPSVWQQVEDCFTEASTRGYSSVAAWMVGMDLQYDNTEHFFTRFTPAINGPF